MAARQPQLPPERSRLMSYTAPNSRPTLQQNPFVDLYTPDGADIVFGSMNDVRRMIPVGSGTGDGMIRAIAIDFPVRVGVTIPWCVGSAPGVGLDSALREALAWQITGGAQGLTVCDGVANPPGHAPRCRFSQACPSSSIRRHDLPYVRERIGRNAETVAPFRTPYLVTRWVKNPDGERFRDATSGVRMERQLWFPWQFCSTCRAVRPVASCTHWRDAMQVRNVDDGGKVRVVREGARSDLDDTFPGSRTITDAVLAQDEQTYG